MSATMKNAGLFALVDAPLRHLPSLPIVVDPLADKDFFLRIQQHNADAGAIGQFGNIIRCHDRCFSIRTRARNWPFRSTSS